MSEWPGDGKKTRRSKVRLAKDDAELQEYRKLWYSHKWGPFDHSDGVRKLRAEISENQSKFMQKHSINDVFKEGAMSEADKIDSLISNGARFLPIDWLYALFTTHLYYVAKNKDIKAYYLFDPLRFYKLASIDLPNLDNINPKNKADFYQFQNSIKSYYPSEFGLTILFNDKTYPNRGLYVPFYLDDPIIPEKFKSYPCHVFDVSAYHDHQEFQYFGVFTNTDSMVENIKNGILAFGGGK